MNMSKLFKIAAAVGLLALVVMQFFRPARTNPTSDPSVSFEAVVKPPQEVVSSLKRACNDCHSNQTVWPWYSNIAPISWLVQSHVDGGRSSLNFSAWDKPQDTSISDIVEAIRSGSMPTWDYKLMHPSANLSSSQKAALIKGLTATLATSPPIGGGG